MPDPLPAYLEPLGAALIAARRSRQPIAVAGLPVPRSDADAYAVQRTIARAFGWFASSAPIAWKVGAASRTATPSAAPLPPGVVHASPATFRAGTFTRILIEGEIAFRLRAPLAADTVHRDPARVLDTIGDLVVTIEIVDPRYDNMNAADPALRLADQLLHGALVVGSGTPWRGTFDWASQAAIVRSNGAIVVQTRGGHPLGDPLLLLPWLAQHVAERQGGAEPPDRAESAPASGVESRPTLAAGDLITAGTWTGVFEAGPGQTIDVEFPGVGRATAVFE